eukprot:1141806-Pelagomonas_calceolata.AAC.1
MADNCCRRGATQGVSWCFGAEHTKFGAHVCFVRAAHTSVNPLVAEHGTCYPGKGYKGYKGKRPQSRRLAASLFISAHETIKEKGKFVILVCKNVEKRSCALKVRLLTERVDLGIGTS